MPQQPPAPGPVKPSRLNLLGRHIVEAREIQNHAVGDLRPQAGEDDAIGDITLVAQNGRRCGAKELEQVADDAEGRVVEPGEYEPDHDLRDHEGEEEHGFVEADAGNRLVQEQRYEQSGWKRQHIEQKPQQVVLERGVEPVVVKHLHVVGDADIAFLAKPVPLEEGDVDGLEDGKDDIDEKEQCRRGKEKHRHHGLGGDPRDCGAFDARRCWARRRDAWACGAWPCRVFDA